LQYYINKTALTKINILNIACGSSREVRELVPDLKTKSSIVLSCLDWDRQALKFSQDALLQIAPKNMQLKFIKEDILNIFKNESVAQSLGRQDIIYSVGLFDYLPNRVFKKLLYALYPLLQKEGRLILTHKNREKTFPIIPPDWFCGWRFIPRNREEVTKLLYDSGISGFSLSTESDDFGYIYYFTLTKKP
jgi:SAM-dependent methyltransferase